MKKAFFLTFSCIATINTLYAPAFDVKHMQTLWHTIGGGAAAALCASSISAISCVWGSELPFDQKIHLTAKIVTLGTFFGGGFSMLVPFFYATENVPHTIPAIIAGGAAGGIVSFILGDMWSENFVQLSRMK